MMGGPWAKHKKERKLIAATALRAISVRIATCNVEEEHRQQHEREAENREDVRRVDDERMVATPPNRLIWAGKQIL